MPLTSDGFPDGPVEDPHDIVVKNMWDMEGRAVSRESPSLSKRFIKTTPESGQGFFRLQKVLLLRRRNDSTRYDSGEMLRYLEAGIGEDKPNDMLKMLRHMEAEISEDKPNTKDELMDEIYCSCMLLAVHMVIDVGAGHDESQDDRPANALTCSQDE